MGRLINAIRRNLRRNRKRPALCSDPDHASLKTNVNELREQLNQLFSRQQQLTELMSVMTEQLKEIVTDAKEGFKSLNNADKVVDLVKEVKKNSPLESEDDTPGERSGYSRDGRLSEGTLCSGDSEEDCSCSGNSDSGDSEEELSCSGGSEEEFSYSDDSEEELSCSDGSEEELSCSSDSEEELSCSGDSEEELSCSGDSEEELSCSGGSEEELSYSGNSEEELSCSDDSKEELSCPGGSEEVLSSYEEAHSEGEHKGSCLEREIGDEDSFQILTNQSSSHVSGQKIDAAEAAEREQLWKEETKAYYDRMLRERPELFYPTYCYIVAPQHYFPGQASSSFSFQHQVSSQAHVSGHPVEESGEHQQLMEQTDQCIHSENEGLIMTSDQFEEELSQSNGNLLIDDNTSCREVEEGSYVEREFSEESSFRILTNQSSSAESVQKIDPTEAAEREQLWKEETKAYYDRMLRERPELFYPVYYIAPQYYSPGQASSSSFVHHQVSSQVFGTANMTSCGCYQCHNSYYRHAQQSIDHKDQYYVQGESKGLTRDHLQVIDNCVSQYSLGANRNRMLDEECEHDSSKVQPPVSVMTETVYPEYNMWSVQRITE